MTGNQLPVYFTLFLRASVNIFRHQTQCGSKVHTLFFFFFFFLSYSPTTPKGIFECVLSVNIIQSYLDFQKCFTDLWTPVKITVNELAARCQAFYCKIYTVKKIRRFYGKTPGIWLPVLLPLFVRAFTCRTFLEIKIW